MSPFRYQAAPRFTQGILWNIQSIRTEENGLVRCDQSILSSSMPKGPEIFSAIYLSSWTISKQRHRSWKKKFTLQKTQNTSAFLRIGKIIFFFRTGSLFYGELNRYEQWNGWDCKRDGETRWNWRANVEIYIRGSPHGAEYAKKTNMCYIWKKQRQRQTEDVYSENKRHNWCTDLTMFRLIWNKKMELTLSQATKLCPFPVLSPLTEDALGKKT